MTTDAKQDDGDHGYAERVSTKGQIYYLSSLGLSLRVFGNWHDLANAHRATFDVSNSNLVLEVRFHLGQPVDLYLLAGAYGKYPEPKYVGRVLSRI